MTDLDAALAAHPPQPEAAISTAAPRRHRHVYDRSIGIDLVYGPYACACGAIQDPAASRRGRLAARRGKDAERRLAKRRAAEGGRRTGMYGGPDDVVDAMFAYQSKAGQYFGWSLRRLVPFLDQLRGRHRQLVPVLYVEDETPGRGRRRLVILDERDWNDIHGGKP